MTLEQIAAMARAHKVTPEEKREQRISLINGVLSQKSTLSRSNVVEILNEIEGHSITPKDKK
jgi:hypothetical protein